MTRRKTVETKAVLLYTPQDGFFILSENISLKIGVRMSKQNNLNSSCGVFFAKTVACFFGLLFGFFILSPVASMQNSAPPPSANAPVVISNGRMISNYHPTPEPPSKSTVRGRVFYEDTGRAVKRASIMLMGKDARGPEAMGLTDNNGYFQIKNVRAGTYYAFVNSPGVVSPLAYADISKPRLEGFGDAVEGFQPIVVNGINDFDVQVPARRGGAIGGRVMYADGDAAIGVKVEILRKIKDKYVPVIPNFSTIFSLMSGGGGFQTDDRGVYRFSGLPAGDYIVKVTENASHSDNPERGYNPFEDSLFGGSSLLTMFYPDVLDTEKAQVVNVALGQEQSEINITIPNRDLYQIEGKIVAAKDKSPVKNARIYLKRNGDNTISIFADLNKRRQSALTDEQGDWNFKELPKGTYMLVVEPPNNLYNEDGEYDGNRMANTNSQRTAAPPKPKFAKKTQEITVEDKNLSQIVVELGYGASIYGTVATENSEEMPPNVSVAAMNETEELSGSAAVYNRSEGENAPRRKTDHDFKLENVAAGKIKFYIIPSGDDFYVKSATLNGTDLLAKPFELKEGENLRGVQIVLSKGVGTVKGKVSDDKREPVKNAEFVLIPTDVAKRKNPTFFRNVRTNENGEFETKAAPDEYAIVFYDKENPAKKGEEFDRWLDDAVRDATKVTVKANETEKITLTLPK